MRSHPDRLRALAAGSAATLAMAVAASAIAATSPEPVVVKDPRADVRAGGLDLTRAQLGRSPDGTLRAALTLASGWAVKDLPSGDGPPGALCVRIWTTSKPGEAPPDRLVCAYADAAGRRLRGVVYRQGSDHLERVADASVSRSSDRTAIVRFSQSSVGRPAKLRFQAESDTPGCARVGCVDTAPDGGGTARLTLRKS